MRHTTFTICHLKRQKARASSFPLFFLQLDQDDKDQKSQEVSVNTVSFPAQTHQFPSVLDTRFYFIGGHVGLEPGFKLQLQFLIG